MELLHHGDPALVPLHHGDPCPGAPAPDLTPQPRSGPWTSRAVKGFVTCVTCHGPPCVCACATRLRGAGRRHDQRHGASRVVSRWEVASTPSDMCCVIFRPIESFQYLNMEKSICPLV